MDNRSKANTQRRKAKAKQKKVSSLKRKAKELSSRSNNLAVGARWVGPKSKTGRLLKEESNTSRKKAEELTAKANKMQPKRSGRSGRNKGK